MNDYIVLNVFQDKECARSWHIAKKYETRAACANVSGAKLFIECVQRCKIQD